MTALVIPEWTRGDRMRKAREEKGIGVSEMASLLVRTRSTIRNYESDSTSPPVSVLRKWAELCDVPLAWIDGNIAHSWNDGLSSPSDQQVLLDVTGQPVDFAYPVDNVVIQFPLRRSA